MFSRALRVLGNTSGAIRHSNSSSNMTFVKYNKDLTPEQLRVLQNGATEAPGTGEYLRCDDSGIYSCRNCGNELYDSNSKFDAACGWPAFNTEIKKGSIEYRKDNSHGMDRTEIMCANCSGHLGHVFEGEGWNQRLGLPFDVRHCVNSASLKLERKK